MTLKGSCPVREGGLVSSVFRRLASYLTSEYGKATHMAKALRERVGKQYTSTQRTRKAVHGECTVELAKWTFPIISRSREPYEVKVSRTGLTGGLGRRAVR